jgi:hypothetical protein
MSSSETSDQHSIDLERDAPTTAADIAMLRRMRRETPTWFSLPAETIETLIPRDALDRRPATRADARPFTLP